MPTYDYRCKTCRTRFSLFYKTYAEYDMAVPHCPQCGSTTLSRLITSVMVSKPTHDYAKMSDREMLSVLDSGDSRRVGEMFQQIGGTMPELGEDYHNMTEQLLKGKSIDEIEEGLQEDIPQESE